ncbi:hypothetical protein [Thalassotalea mangrovi]|uniref:Uncharacterized protein n=1 Tax=Thalassotalea mangrovi TaxID=2572245 RepID=A0A4U1B722_9GAMM|nr:hypothetical protein [Thalassotalea mangrovi]TKB46374.1 hypothetical protein E8M12_04790 [Thalassotalea mangrovi]
MTYIDHRNWRAIIISCLCVLVLSACQVTCDLEQPPLVPGPVKTGSHFSSGQFASLSELLSQLDDVDVLLVTDHTLPEHLNMGTGGAQGKERVFIDPAATLLARELNNLGLNSFTLNVEDMTFAKGELADKASVDFAYGEYDKVLQRAVANGITIIALHFDADIMIADGETVANYIGGTQIIFDPDSLSESSFKLGYYLLHDYQVLESLLDAGFRPRPGYRHEFRFQANQTLKIIGDSTGGGLLLELASQEQAMRLYRSPEAITAALQPSLQLLARAISDFRWQLSQSDKKLSQQ